MTHTLIRARIMPGVQDWWDKHVGKEPIFNSLGLSTKPIVWWLPDGQLLDTRPPESNWTPESNREPTWAEVTHYFAMPCRAIFLEYGDSPE